jgi:hypothetical protein
MLASRLVLSFSSSRARHGLLGLSLAVAAACGDTTAPDSGSVQPSGDGDGDGDMAANAPFGVASDDWKYVEISGTFCRDGSPAGINVSPHADSKNLMIFLEGGGACWDTLTCFANPGSITEISKAEQTAGLFDRSNKDNPVGDWNIVYVPYCTGDVHAGANPDGKVDGKKQMFVGYTNMGVILKQVADEFPDLENVLLTGVSAGGFGASANIKQVMDAFPDAKGTLLDDSGPAMSSKYVPTCLQTAWRDTWGLDKSMLKACGDACPNADDFLQDYAVHMAKSYPDRKSGMIESIDDAIITSFFGEGLNNCTGKFGTDAIPADQFKAGLLEFREAVKDYPNFGTWYPEGTQHTWLQYDNSVYSAKIGDKKLIDWVTGIINNTAVSNVGGE